MSTGDEGREIGRPVHAYDRTLLAKLGFSDRDKCNPRHDLVCEYISTSDRLLSVFGDLTGESPRRFDGLVCDVTPTPSQAGVFTVKIDGSLYKGRTMSRGSKPLGLKQRFLGVKDSSIWLESVSIEHPVSKGEGQYKTTIGFLDVHAVVHREWSYKVAVEIPLWDDAVADKRVGLFKTTHIVQLDDWNHTVRTEEYGRYGRRAREEYIPGGLLAVEVKIHPVSVGEIVRQLKLYQEYVHNCDWAVVTDFDLDAGACGVLHREGIRHARLGRKFESWLATRKKTGPARVREV